MDTDVKQNDVIAFNPISVEGRLTYSGSTKGGKPDGRGEMFWNNGRKYKGYFKDDVFHGFGCLIYEKESLFNYYEGQWKDDQRSGQGTLVWNDSKIEKGQWEDGKLNTSMWKFS